MTGWVEAPLAAFDLETTSPDPLTARIVTACVLEIDGSAVTARNWLLDPGIEIPEEASAIHGVTTERARAEGQEYSAGYDEIRAALEGLWAAGRVVALYNASYDLTLMNEEGKRLGDEPMAIGPAVDPFTIDREVDRYRRGKRTLSVTCEHYGLTLDSAHDAAADALAAARLAWVLGRRYPAVAALTVDELMTAQAGWHRARQDDYRAYLQRNQEDASGLCGDWPIRNG